MADAPFQSIPVPDQDSAPFWEAAKRHELVFQRCSACGQDRFPPAPICWRCRSWDAEWVQSDGLGTVYSWVVVAHPIPPGIAPLVPYVVALVEIEPMVKLPTRLVHVRPDEVTADMEVEVVFEDIDGGMTLPLFRPRGAADTQRRQGQA
jgi:uncharacterized OB-fold protein